MVRHSPHKRAYAGSSPAGSTISGRSKVQVLPHPPKERKKVEKIKEEDYFKVVGILNLCNDLMDKLEFMEKSLAKILNVPKQHGTYGHVSDAVWGEYDADLLLERLGLEIDSS